MPGSARGFCAADDRGATFPIPRPKGAFALVATLLAVHGALLAWSATRHSPTWEEVAIMASGISHWTTGRFDLFRVNPPLSRLVATAPVMLTNPELQVNWSRYSATLLARPEFEMGHQFVLDHRLYALSLIQIGRWASIPFSLLGGLLCYCWARRLYGTAAGLLALSLWCFSPTLLAHGQLMTPDVAAAALGVAAAYSFWHWLKSPGWAMASLSGIVFGLAQLTKMTLVIFFLLWPLLWLVWRLAGRRQRAGRAVLAEASQLALILLLALYVINLGYGFEGSLRPLGRFPFLSQVLAGHQDRMAPSPTGANRFARTWLGTIPVPLPENYLRGIDVQRSDFERTMWSYLRGEWRRGGWWYYYLYGVAVKEPLGTWVLGALALLATLFRRGFSATRLDELTLLAPCAVVFALVSSQTGFNHHVRYVLPAFPFAYIWTSKVARAVELGRPWLATIAAGALAWAVASTLFVYPHTLSFFNELVGGPKGGHYHLGNSNTECGQDLLYLKRWLKDHRQAQPLQLGWEVWTVEPAALGIEYSSPRADGPYPGWYAMSIRAVHDKEGYFAHFLRLQPTAMAGYSILIYHITLEEANRLRRERGLPELPAPSTTSPSEATGSG